MNGHDFTLEQNTEARMMLAVARRGLAAAINDAENGIGHLSCDDPKIMEQVRAHWRRLYDTYMNADALLSDLESCARHLTDGDKWEPNPIADGMKPMEMAKGCACFIAETPDGGLIIPSEPTPGENTAKRLANTLNALTGDVLLDATGIRLLGTQFLFAYHSRLDRPVDYGVNLTGMRFPDRLGLLDRHPGSGVVAKFMLREKRLPLAFIDPDGTFMQTDEYGGKPERIPFAAWRWAGYDLALFEGEPDAVLVQQKARMRYEYRVQVIGGKPVCGAGCIERFTPADNRGNRYDPRMEETRNSGRIESHPDIARLYEQFAHEAAHAIRGEIEGPYVMDLYLDDAGRPHVIELNPQSNSGLYALDMDALLTAIGNNPAQFMPDPKRTATPGCLGVREGEAI